MSGTDIRGREQREGAVPEWVGGSGERGRERREEGEGVGPRARARARAEPPLGRAMAAALSPSRRRSEHICSIYVNSREGT
jgi:hypothetical protein